MVVVKANVHERFQHWLRVTDSNECGFQGVSFSQLHIIEETFKVRLNVYQVQQDRSVFLIRRTPEVRDFPLLLVDLQHIPKSDVTHFSLILDLERYGRRKFFCKFCNVKFTRSHALHLHMTIKGRCRRGNPEKKFIGGVHREQQDIFEHLKFLNIPVDDFLPRYNPFFAVYDFESMLQSISLNTDSGEMDCTDNPMIIRPHNETREDRSTMNRHELPIHTLGSEDDPKLAKKQQFFQRHIPISFSVFSSIPGYDVSPFTMVEPDVGRLIEAFVDYLKKLAAARTSHLRNMYSVTIVALEMMLEKAEKVYSEKKERKEYTDMARLHLRKVVGVHRRFESWLDQCPVIGFNSGKYDIPLISEYLAPLLVQQSRDAEDNNVVYDFDRRVAKYLRIPMYSRKDGEEDVEIGDEQEHKPTQSIFKKNNFVLPDIAEDDVEEMDEDDVEETDEDDVEETDEDDQMEEEVDSDDHCFDDEDFECKLNDKKVFNIPENPPVKIKGFPSITKRGNSILCIRTDSLIFLDMTLYLAAGTSLNKFQNAWQAADVARKGVPPRSAFFSQLRGKNIGDEEYELVKKLYEKHGIDKFVDYLRLYNETDVRPFLQACQKQHMQYFDQCAVDMFKSCISLPGITLKYLSSKIPNYQFALWTSKDEELQREMRSDMTGGLSIVQHRLAVAGETIIRSNEISKGERPEKDFHVVISIQGYDANALYLWAVGQDMPCGFHTLWKNSANGVYMFKDRCSKPDAAVWLQYCALNSGHEIINKWTHGFEQQLGPIQIPVDGYCAATKTVYEYLGCYWHCHGSPECRMGKVTDKNVKTKKDKDQCKKELQERKFYIESLGMKLHQVLQYDKGKPFPWFVDKVTSARAAADCDPSLEILGQGYKLLGNTAYGKTVTDLASHTDSYIVPYAMARELANDPFLTSLEPISNTDCYTVVMRKRHIRHTLPEQVGIAVYQWAKLRMLQFAYDFLGEFCGPYKYAWMQSDTDSAYIMMAEDRIEDIVLPEKRAEFEAKKHEWLALSPADKRIPGLFKLEYFGEKMVCLNPKSYHVVGPDGDSKSATKGVNKTCHFQFDQFVNVLKTGNQVSGYNVGFRKIKNDMLTYLCERVALTYYYGKRFVMEDGIHTQPNPTI